MARFVEVSVSYPIPHNWKWDSIGNYAKIKSGYPFDSEKFSDDPTGRQPLIRIRDILRESTNTFTDECCPEEYIIHAGDILIGMDGDFNVGKWNSDDALLNQRVCYIQSNSNCLLNDYLLYYLPGILKIINNATPSVTVKHLSANTLRKTQIPLPPLAEQQRIVDRIESLFTKLDEAKEKAQAVVDSFETRKAAILHKAFTGELTAKWREEHGVGMDSWRWIPLKKSGSWYGGGTPSMSRSEYWENGTLLWVTAKDMKSDLIEDTLMHTNMFGVENSSANYIAQPAVLFVMRSGILRRTFPVCMVKKPFTVNQDIKALVPTDNIDLEYLFWGCKANEKRILESCMKNGTTVESINSAALRDFEIPIAGSNEQIEIVRILDAFFTKEQQAKEAAEKVLDQIELMKKSILARAFRGELGTNDPSEESAVELLKRTIL